MRLESARFHFRRRSSTREFKVGNSSVTLLFCLVLIKIFEDFNTLRFMMDSRNNITLKISLQKKVPKKFQDPATIEIAARATERLSNTIRVVQRETPNYPGLKWFLFQRVNLKAKSAIILGAGGVKIFRKLRRTRKRRSTSRVNSRRLFRMILT